MSIVIIRGPENAALSAPEPRNIPKEVVSHLVQRASQANRTIAVRTCQSESEVLDCLRQLGKVEFVMFDPGDCACNDESLQTTLERLPVPYIEVHDDMFGALERKLAPDCGRPLNVVQGYGAQSYTLALSMALEHLGCAECENDYHVGI